ncbi:MAG: transcription termination factor NusA [Candidatus Levyibacteriota bacterium]
MPGVQRRSEFALALNQVANERGVDVSVVLDTVKNAILAAYKKDHPDVEVEEYEATLDKNTGEARIFTKGKDVTPPGFGRIAAQTAKQVILQKIREKEKEAILTDYKGKVGAIVNGMVLRFAGPNVIVDIGKTEALMPPPEQIPNEKYHLNQRLTVYIMDIREGQKGEEIIVSRANNGLIEGLFKREVPEVAQGSVVIKEIAREPGSRTKIAVSSNQSGIDPVGSCVGQKGVRIQAIIAEFSGIEKIDVIQWHENPKNYIAQALSPAKNVDVTIDEKSKTARVILPKEELSLAIGKEGQNVRLASKLSGYRIEIEGKEDENALAEEVKEEDKKSEEAKVEETNEQLEPARNASPARQSPDGSSQMADGQSDAGGEKLEVPTEPVQTAEAEAAPTESTAGVNTEVKEEAMEAAGEVEINSPVGEKEEVQPSES